MMGAESRKHGDDTGYVGLLSEQIRASLVQLRDTEWVRLDDFQFTQHGLGPRYARVCNLEVEGAWVSYAYLDGAETVFDLITMEWSPVALGTAEEIAARNPVIARSVIDTLLNQSRLPTLQRQTLAILHALDTQSNPGSGAVMRDIVQWVAQYEKRACWIAKHRREAYVLDAINWRGLGL